MGCQDDYVMRTVSDLVRAIARLVLGKNNIDYNLLEDEDGYTDLGRVYKGLKDLMNEGNVNDAENLLTDELGTNSLDCLKIILTSHMYLNQLKDGELYAVNYSRGKIVDGVSSVYVGYDISEFEHFVDTVMV